MQTISSKLLRVEKLTNDVFHYEFDFGGLDVDFKAGQFMMLKVDDGKEPPVNRSYSIASAPIDKDHFALCVKLIEEGRGSEYLRGLEPGDTAEFLGPVGHFVLKENDKSIVMVGTGTGLAPFMGMIETLFDRGFEQNVTLLFGVRHDSDLFYLDRLKEWEETHDNFKTIITLSRPEDSWEGEEGRVTDHFEKMELDPENTDVYICGNGNMVIDIKKMAEAKGLDKKSIAFEQFTPVGTKG